ncbi:hypothetical protein ABK040_011099 [Willaertia magna]
MSLITKELVAACMDGKIRIVKSLIQRYGKQYVDSTDDFGWTPLLTAAQFGRVEVVNYLLEQGADINQVNKFGNALFIAALEGHEDVVKILLKHGAETKVKCPSKSFLHDDHLTPLQAAQLRENYSIVKLLEHFPIN